jgi:hypothetical protein
MNRESTYGSYVAIRSDGVACSHDRAVTGG